MRFNFVSALLAGATLVQYAAASPIRVTVVTSSADVSTNVSFGNVRPVPMMQHDAVAGAQGAGRHCSQFKDKALALSNKLREAFGLQPIQPLPPLPPLQPLEPLQPLKPLQPIQSIQPQRAQPLSWLNDDRKIEAIPVVGSPRRPFRAPVSGNNGGRLQILPVTGTPVQPVFHHGHGQGLHHRARGSFLHRVHRALMTLGPWEGRAVAFVLGCGIGVLLRMFWVMAIVVARTVRGGRSDADVDAHDILVFEADAEHIVDMPPQYTDEKVALAAPSDAECETKA